MAKERIKWDSARRAKYAQLIKARKPWEKAGVKSEEGKDIVKWNSLKTGKHAASILEIRRLLHETNKIIFFIAKRRIPQIPSES